MCTFEWEVLGLKSVTAVGHLRVLIQRPLSPHSGLCLVLGPGGFVDQCLTDGSQGEPHLACSLGHTPRARAPLGGLGPSQAVSPGARHTSPGVFSAACPGPDPAVTAWSPECPVPLCVPLPKWGMLSVAGDIYLILTIRVIPILLACRRQIAAGASLS